LVDWTDPETLWLNVTNAALGILVLACVLVVVLVLGAELRLRWKRRAGRLRIIYPETRRRRSDG
jgi:hypothetical protein